MDLLLSDGGLWQSPLGMPKQIDGLEFLLQQAYLCLQVHAGTLPWMPTFGSRLYRLSPVQANVLQALQCAQDALQYLGGVQALAVQIVQETAGPAFLVTVQTPRGTGTVTIEGGTENGVG